MSFVILASAVAILVCTGFFGKADNSLRDSDIVQVTGVLRGRAELPCDLSTPPDDQITLVLWYRNDSGIPIYSLDVRNSDSVESASHLPSEMLGKRAFLRISYPHAFLQLEPVKEQDEGLFKCRVDFKTSRTRNSRVNLTVIVPPEEVFIVDDAGQEVNNPLTVNEGSKLILSCTAIGGRPPPRVTWWRASKLLQESSEVSSSGKVRSDLILPRLNRNDLNSNLTCQASNTNLTVPVSKIIMLDLSLRPLTIRILGDQEPVSAGKRYEMTCQTNGSQPQPTVMWYKQNRRLRNSKETLSADGNTTTSVVSFIPSSHDNGKHLTCRVENPRMSGSVLESSFRLEVHYPPNATLDLGSSLKMENLKEGDDVYFVCSIQANPKAYRVDWKFEGRFLNQDINAGIIFSAQSLVLQKVKRSHAGRYSCVAKNVEGDGESNSINLKIKHVPVCRTGLKLVYGVAKHETAKIICEVVAHPYVVSFKWAFNSTFSEYLDVATSKFTSGGLRSTINYTPVNEQDYGILYCWARNDIGEQRQPCNFTVIPAGPPDSLHNCTIQNYTEDALHVECVEGFDGGLQQYFIMEVYDSTAQELTRNVTSPLPIFQVNDLRPNTGFMISIYAANSKGRGESYALTGSTLPSAEKRTSERALITITPILGVLIGVVAALVLVAVIIVIVMRLRAPDEKKSENNEHDHVHKFEIYAKKEFQDFENPDEKNPDVVPPEEDVVYADVDEKVDQKLNILNNRIYENMTNSLNPNVNEPSFYENVNNIKNQQQRKPRLLEDVTYAELQLPNNQRTSSTIHRGAEPTVYAQIDHTRKAPPMTEDDEVPTAETPLMNAHRESTVQDYGSGHSFNDTCPPTVSSTQF